MSGLVLNFGQQNIFPFQRGRPQKPVTFGLHTNDFRVTMLGHLANQILTVTVWHPVPGFNLFFRSNLGGKLLLLALLDVAGFAHTI